MQRQYEVRSNELPPELRRVSSWYAIVDLGLAWILVFATAAVAARVGELWFWLLAVTFIAILQNRLMVLWHHSIHYNIHPSRRVNDTLGRWLLIAPMGQPWGMMRRAHMTHHNNLGKTQDQDRWYYDLDLHGRRRPGLLLGWLLFNFLGGLLYPQVRKVLTGKRDDLSDPGTEYGAEDRYDMLAAVICQAALFAIFFLCTGAWWAYFACWALPLATLGGGLNCLRTTLEHADHAEPARRGYSYRSNLLERFILAPACMNYHWEHHVNMTVPYYRMRALRRWLLEQDRYGDGRLLGSYMARLRELVIGVKRRASASNSPAA